MNVLLVEDDPAAARLIRELFRDLPHPPVHLTHVEQLSDALSELREGSTEVVLLDLNLPDSAGLDTVRRCVGAFPAVPVVVMTTLKDDRMGVEALQLGAQDYLFKGEAEGPLLVRSLRYAQERKRIQEALKKSECTYRTLFQSTGTATAILEEDLSIEMVNEEFGRILYRMEELKRGITWADLVTRDEREAMLAYITERKENPSSTLPPFECRARDRSGYLHSFLVSFSPIPDTSRAILSLAEITEIRKLEKREREHIRDQAFLTSTALKFIQLPSTELIFRQIGEDTHRLVRQSTVAVCSYDPDQQKFRITMLFGRKKAELQKEEASRKVLEGIPLRMTPLLRRKCMQGSLERLRGGITPLIATDLPERLKSILGDLLAGDLYVIGFPNDKELLGFLLLVTDKAVALRKKQVLKNFFNQAGNALRRKYAEEELATIRGRLQHLLDSTPAMIYAAELQEDNTPVYSFVSDNIKDFLGYNPHEVLHNRLFWQRKVHEQDQDDFIEQAVPFLYKKGAVAVEYRVKGRNGTYKWICDGLKRVGGGDTRSIVGFWMDITDRKHMEEALMIKHGALESVALPMALTDTEMHVVYMNGAALAGWGYQTSDEVLGRPLTEFIGPQSAYKRLTAALKEDHSWEGDIRALRKDGTRFEGRLTVNGVKDAEELPCYVLSLQDRTEQKKIERELKRLRGLLEGVIRKSSPGSPHWKETMNRGMAPKGEAARR